MDNMNITSAKYVQREGVNETILATIDGKTMTVPLDPDNRHYDEIKKRVEAGDLTIADAD